MKAITDRSCSADDLLCHLMNKFNRLLEGLQSEEAEKKRLAKVVLDLEMKIQSYNDFDQVLGTQEVLRENENLK